MAVTTLTHIYNLTIQHYARINWEENDVINSTTSAVYLFVHINKYLTNKCSRIYLLKNKKGC